MERQMRARGGVSSVENLRSSAENILRLGRAPAPGPEIPTSRDGELHRKGQAALDLVNSVADTIQVTEGRIETLLVRALDQLRTMEERNRVLEQQLKAAESRAREAEKWLVRLHVEIEDKFTSWRAGRPGNAAAA
jgi:flagellar basal body rod protein FlgF